MHQTSRSAPFSKVEASVNTGCESLVLTRQWGNFSKLASLVKLSKLASLVKLSKLTSLVMLSKLTSLVN